MHALDSLTPAPPAERTTPAPPRPPVPVRPAAGTRSNNETGAAAPAAGTAGGVARPGAPVRPAAPNKAAGAPAVPAKAGQQPSGVSAGAVASRPSAPSVVPPAPLPALPGEQPAPPPAVTTVPAQTPSSVPLPPPVRLVFETGTTDLTAGNEAAVRNLAHAIPAPEGSSVNVVAYAAGKPDDPSTARRVSLSRGMAVRSVLMDSGVPSAQIYVRALGATPSDGPADRVELIVARPGTVTR